MPCGAALETILEGACCHDEDCEKHDLSAKSDLEQFVSKSLENCALNQASWESPLEY